MNIWPSIHSEFCTIFHRTCSFSVCLVLIISLNKTEPISNFRHIEEDLKAQGLPEKKVEELTEEERNYLFFKVHDLDGNDKLDGLEIFYSATHHHSITENEHSHGTEHDHDHESNESNESDAASEANAVSEADEANENETENSQLSNDSAANSDASDLKLLELDENGQIRNKNFNHIIGL